MGRSRTRSVSADFDEEESGARSRSDAKSSDRSRSSLEPCSPIAEGTREPDQVGMQFDPYHRDSRVNSSCLALQLPPKPPPAPALDSIVAVGASLQPNPRSWNHTRKQIQCFKCGGWGHIARMCSFPRDYH
eukprot:1355641-Amphidinium_carterae.1